jgi:hypothetical protein
MSDMAGTSRQRRRSPRAQAAAFAVCLAALAVVLPSASASPTPSCSVLTAARIKSVLGFKVNKPSVQAAGPIAVCTYIGAAHEVIMRLQTGMSHANWVAGRSQFDANGEPTKDYTGLGYPAFSSSVSGGAYSAGTNAIDVLKGSSNVLITGPAPLPKIVALVKFVLPNL